MAREFIQGGYQSPRWTQEITDCSMPMTLDTYSGCSFRCLYCFSFFQKAVGVAKTDYLKNKVESVSVRAIKDIFALKNRTNYEKQFYQYIKERKVLQWGGLADQFDEYERRLGVSLQLLEFFRKIQYPVSMSTKSVWFTEDDRYMRLIQDAEHFHFKISIITLDEMLAKKIEVLCPPPKERLKAIERLAKAGVGGVTLRMRPYIIGVTSRTATELLKQAKEHGADSVSTEFLCIEERSKLAKHRFEEIGRMGGYDLLKMYKMHSPGQSGYLRMNRKIKQRYVDAMKEVCDKVGLRLYISDAHFKELCANSSCCGLSPKFNYSRGQFTKALLLAKEKGTVRWSDISWDLKYAEGYLWRRALGFNSTSCEKRAQFHNFSMKDWMHYIWNNVKSKKSLYHYFGGILHPVGKDENGDVIYEYRGEA